MDPHEAAEIIPTITPAITAPIARYPRSFDSIKLLSKYHRFKFN